MTRLWTIFPLALLLCSTALGQGVNSETHLGGCILLKPGAEAPDDVYYETDIIRTDEFRPFTKRLSVYGITLIGRDDISDAFMRKVAKTVKEIFPQGGTIDGALQKQVLRNLHRYRAVIPIFKGDPGFSSEEDWKTYRNMKRQNSACDIIMEGVSRQVMEVVEHILHHVTDVGLHYTFPNEWGISKTSKLYQFMLEAVDKGYYDVSSYGEIDDEAPEGVVHPRERVMLQEFAYVIITTAWNLQEPYGGGGDEWTNGGTIRNADDLKEKMPQVYELYEQTVGTIMAPPSSKTLAEFPSPPERHRSTDNEASAK